MRILFVWTGVTSYMADCWRKLAAEPGVELKVIIEEKAEPETAFRAEEVLRDLDYKIVRGGDEETGWRPDVMFIVGWHAKTCRAFVESPRFKDVPKVCCFDMPWRWKIRCLVAPFVLGRFLKNYRAAFVPGEVCARYARWLGFRNVHKGLFGIDTQRFRPCGDVERAEGYFLYVGRNSSEKRLGDIRAAHRLYCEQGGKLELRMYGKGLEGGFVTPEEVPALMQGAAAFVLASDFDPWPLVLLEAMSAGCPIIASDRCTNRPELGKNWHVFKVGDVKELAKAMLAIKPCSDAERVENMELARQYDCVAWVKRVMKIAEEVV